MDKEKILDHELVPKHEILDEEEAEEVLEKYGAKEGKMPKIKENDNVIKAIGAEPGDLIKITRDSPTAGKSLYYRRVVEK